MIFNPDTYSGPFTFTSAPSWTRIGMASMCLFFTAIWSTGTSLLLMQFGSAPWRRYKKNQLKFLIPRFMHIFFQSKTKENIKKGNVLQKRWVLKLVKFIKYILQLKQGGGGGGSVFWLGATSHTKNNSPN